MVVGRGNGRRKYFTGRHITDPAEAARIMSREVLEKRVLPSRIIAAGNTRLLKHDVTGLDHPLSEWDPSAKCIGEPDHPGMLKSLSQKQRHPDSCPLVRHRYFREPTIHLIHDTYDQPIYLG